MTMSRPPFRIRVRMGDLEVEIGGEREQVLSTLDELNGIVEKVSDAFNLDARTSQPEQVKTTPEPMMFPKIPRTTQCGDAVTTLLSTDWGKTPRTIAEIREAMEANAIFFPKTTLSGVLVWLVKRNKVRRWKDKKRGYVYMLHSGEGA